ncbi:multifunctional methyltransferase subunit TRM112-like protein [Ptychodera flava]|uniref:multifunctional methyltransferase subunit TRM112-like protein n=1 Tax=Ptychodera flava TaxID=63121 RepID=UPI003969F6F5
MKLLTHNMLISQVKGVTNGYPLAIEAKEVRVQEVDFNPEFISRMIAKIEWEVLYKAAQSIGHLGDLPAEPVEDHDSNEDFLKEAHRVILEVEVIEGNLVCPESGRKFPISNGIPNMKLNEDEV